MSSNGETSPSNTIASHSVLDYKQIKCVTFGFVRHYMVNKYNINIQADNIAGLIFNYMVFFTKFTFDYCNKQVDHYILDDKKTFKCHTYGGFRCPCVACCYTEMHPNSGIYQIKMRIDTIYDGNLANMFGITFNTNKEQTTPWDVWFDANDYIGWSVCGHTLQLEYGLKYQTAPNKNVFFKSIKYISNNQFYRDGLPRLKKGDIIILEYNSYQNSLSFKFERDVKLDSKIVGLPKNKSFYWMVGHNKCMMSITIVD